KTRLLLDHGADVDARSAAERTPLFIAAGQTNSAAVVKLLLDRGANPNGRVGAAANPILRPARFGNVEVVRLLVERGATVNSATLVTALRNCAECFRILVNSGAVPSFKDTWALLDVFASHEHYNVEAARVLIEQGANVNARDSKGRTVLMTSAGTESVSR